MSASLVGRIRLNTAVSDQVIKEFKKFPAPMDRIEIFDNSIPNDPSPPCKSAAVMHRSSAVIRGQPVPCVTVFRRKIYDYNNRDFQSYQLENLLDSIATNYLRDRGGGFQLTVYRQEKTSRFSSTIHGSDIASFCMSKETRDQKNFLTLPCMRFFFNPLRSGENIARIKTEPSEAHIEGLTPIDVTYEADNCKAHVIAVDNYLRNVSILLESPEPISRQEAKAVSQSVMRDMLCMEATVFSDSFAQSEFDGALAVNRRIIGSNVPEMTKWQFPLYSEFIM